jgi:hypothetical protein
MAGDAVLGVKLCETGDIGWGFPFVGESRLSWRLAGNEAYWNQKKEEALHEFSSGASMPSLAAIESDCIVTTFSSLKTT